MEQSSHQIEVSEGNRFKFGENWAKFLQILDEPRMLNAEKSLCEMLSVESLAGKKFLDIGCGSGLFSLAAMRLGADVYSFDFDPKSVACAQELKKRYYNDSNNWQISEGSVLDKEFIKSLGEFDIVYSWGVLHHTGHMYEALENAALPLSAQGQLFIAIYNDQGRPSKRWLAVKKLYNKLPSYLRWVVLWPSILRLWGPTIIRDTMHGSPLETWSNYTKNHPRGMTPRRDIVDWVGGLPFEVAKPEEIFEFYKEKQFTLQKMKTCAGGLGCNEFVFRKLSK